MALCMALRRSAAALRVSVPRSRSSRTMVVRAFRESEETKASKAEQKAHLSTRPTSGEKSVAPRRDALASSDVMPLRRMASAMNALQREMEDMINTFGMLDMPGFTSRRAPLSLFDTMAGDFFPSPTLTSSVSSSRFNRMVPMEVEEMPDKYLVRAEIPGFTKENVKVSFDPAQRLVTVSGVRETKETAESEEGGARMQSQMSFQRSFSVPDDMDMDKPLIAKAQHGILTLELPRSKAKAAPALKEIPVE